MKSVNSWNLTNNKLHQLFKENNEFISIEVRGNTWEPITRWLRLDSRIFRETTSKARITLCDIESLAEINDINALFKKRYVSEAYMQADALKKKIRDMRQVGLDGEGTYSVENLAFKLLRNNGFVKKLGDIKENSYDILMSVGSSPVIRLNITDNLDEKKKKRRKKSKKGPTRVTYSRNPRSKKGYSGKNHWNVGGWWYNGSSGGDSGGDGGGGE